MFGRHRVINVRKLNLISQIIQKDLFLHLYICEIVTIRHRICGKVVFLVVCLSVRGGSCTSTLSNAPATGPRPQTCSLCSPYGRQAGGWHLTEMPSYCYLILNANTFTQCAVFCLIFQIKNLRLKHQKEKD